MNPGRKHEAAVNGGRRAELAIMMKYLGKR